ncbi:hypothetical protein B0A49_07385 [Cryomyces minteri]|uniref:Uncharacterized protein n=1 Tax=Cryomyces minteri TaxID=331657 RepID=A0A4U0WNB9_9PEZI|nr:hypothetical protein B0A49_07385 [Cryomyces minteri]
MLEQQRKPSQPGILQRALSAGIEENSRTARRKTRDAAAAAAETAAPTGHTKPITELCKQNLDAAAPPTAVTSHTPPAPPPSQPESGRQADPKAQSPAPGTAAQAPAIPRDDRLEKAARVPRSLPRSHPLFATRTAPGAQRAASHTRALVSGPGPAARLHTAGSRGARRHAPAQCSHCCCCDEAARGARHLGV